MDLREYAPAPGSHPARALQSILFQDTRNDSAGEPRQAPDYFTDLNLDQIVAAITAGREEYDLKPFFYAPLRHVEAIAFRHEIMRDLEQGVLCDSMKTFARGMRTVRERLAQTRTLHHSLQKQRWFFDAAHGYCQTVSRLADDLAAADPRSRGLLAFRDFLNGYCSSGGYTQLLQRTTQLAADIAAIGYTILVEGARVEVRQYDGEPDYSAEILGTFERFKQGADQKYKFDFSETANVNHIEGQILERVSRLFSDTFAKLDGFCTSITDFQDPAIVTFDREVEFYLAYLDYMARFKQLGLSFCYPRVTEAPGTIFNDEGFDLALAATLLSQNTAPVTNDFHLTDPERMIVVTGPNQGGKTTFARTFAQLHYLASLGCPVPGTRAQLFLFDRLFTHFGRAENIASASGKLQDDLVRIHRILEAVTPHSIVILNEIFASTTLRDAVALSKKIAAALMRRDLYCVWVTFIDELASLGPQTVSVVSMVVPENPALRTYKIVRRPADGLAHALSIAEKCRLTYDMIRDRIGP
jgi:DNA mismatch repair protein MutS